MTEILNKFVDSLKNTIGENLVSIILFGSRARNLDSSSKSDFNLLLVLKSSRYELLELLDKGLLKRWVNQRNPVPLIFTEGEFKKSNDVFPIEFEDIISNHKVLFGKDVLSGLKIDNSNLKHQCEYELKSKLVRLRQHWLVNRRKKKAILNILMDSISSVLTVIKHIVKLTGENIPEKKIDAPGILAKKTNINPEIFNKIYSAKHNEKDGKILNPEEAVKEYLIQIEKIVNFVDNLKD